jgi:hypothetical protein
MKWTQVLKKQLSEDDPRLWGHMTKIRSLVRMELVNPDTGRRRTAVDQLDWITNEIARTMAERGDVVKARKILAEDLALVRRTGSSDTAGLRRALTVYGMIGQPAPAVRTQFWHNAPLGRTTLPLVGKVTILHFTASPRTIGGFQPDTTAYRLLRELPERIDPTAVQLALVVPIFKKRTADKRDIPVDTIWQESRTYWDELHIARPIAGDVEMDSLFHAYGIRGFPYWFVVDKKGIVRNVAFGVRSDLDTWMSNRVRTLIAEN